VPSGVTAIDVGSAPLPTVPTGASGPAAASNSATSPAAGIVA